MDTYTNHNENPNDSGMEFLKQILLSNENNAKMCQLLSSRIDDLEVKLGSFELTVDSAHACYNEANDFSTKEEKKRVSFLEKFPKTVALVMPDSTIEYLDDLKAKSVSFKRIFQASILNFVLSITFLVFFSFFAFKWYQESIRTKEEIREEVLQNVADEKKIIVDQTHLIKLENNTKIMQSWMKTNSDEVKDFKKFKAGFEAR